MLLALTVNYFTFLFIDTDTWKEDLIDSLLEKLPEVHEDPAGEHLSQEESSRGRKRKIINYANIGNDL